LRVGGFSLVELSIVIAVLGILAAIAVPTLSGIMQASQVEVAQRNLNLLNGAVINYGQSIGELTNAAGQDSAVLTLLKARDESVPGTPFLATNMANVTSSSTNTYRAVWNGRVFSMADVGVAGSGVDLLEMSTNP